MSRAGLRPASELVADLLTSWAAMEFCLSRSILFANSSLACLRPARELLSQSIARHVKYTRACYVTLFPYNSLESGTPEAEKLFSYTAKKEKNPYKHVPVAVINRELQCASRGNGRLRRATLYSSNRATNVYNNSADHRRVDADSSLRLHELQRNKRKSV